MSYFRDLSPYAYHHDDPAVLMVGWLDAERVVKTGDTSPEFRDALAALCERPMRLFRGWHSCNLCPGASWLAGGKLVRERNGNGEIRVRKNGKWYAAPKLIGHYVTAHNYLPPEEFIAAVLAPDEIGTDKTEYPKDSSK